MVKCQICGKEMNVVSPHLRSHKVSMAEYKIKYPGVKVVSEEQAAKHRESNAIRGRSEFTCIRCGKIMSINNYFAKRRKFCSVECCTSHVRENPFLHQERNNNISKSNKGISRPGRYSRCRGGIREDLGHYVRSGWEADVCRILKFNSKKYEYESFVVELNDNGEQLFWTIDIIDVDHFLSDGLIEIKGWMDEKSAKKLKLLQEQRPHIYNSLTIIDYPKMRELTFKYRPIVPNWETRKLKGAQ